MAAKHGPLAGNELAAAISDKISQLHARYYGKGPRQAKTYIGGDYVFCVLMDPFTTVEPDANRTRQAPRRALDASELPRHEEQRLTEVVHKLSGRKASVLMGQTHEGPDLGIEIFKFEQSE